MNAHMHVDMEQSFKIVQILKEDTEQKVWHVLICAKGGLYIYTCMII